MIGHTKYTQMPFGSSAERIIVRLVDTEHFVPLPNLCVLGLVSEFVENLNIAGHSERHEKQKESPGFW